MSNNRLPPPYGLRLQRQKPISFTFDGKRFTGYSGDTIASALAANNQWLLSRSFKYHRPRGVLTMAGQDANTLVQLPSNPNALADVEKICPDLKVSCQNVSGSLQRDRLSWLGYLSRFLPVAFYYKAFFRPKGVWELWARLIRKQAGLGRIDESLKPGYYDKEHCFYDVMVIGGGPAGLSAALTAADAGAKVLLVDENTELGGSLNYTEFPLDGLTLTVQRQQLMDKVNAHAAIEVKTDAVCNGWFADNWLAVITEQRLFKVRAKQVIMAMGSFEQAAVFRNNDLPGIMMSSAALRLIHLYAVRPGQKAVVLCGNWDGYSCALALTSAGVKVQALLDLRERPDAGHPFLEKVEALGISVRFQYQVRQAVASRTGNHLAAVEVCELDSGNGRPATASVLACDLLVMAVGYTPAYQLACQAGGHLSYDDSTAAFVIENLPENCFIAGSMNAVWGLDNVIADGGLAAGRALKALGQVAEPRLASVDEKCQSPNFAWPIFPHSRGKEFVDFDEDLQVEDIVNAVNDGYEHVQLVKRYSTAGMGPSQGRHSALALARLVAVTRGISVSETGVTTARPPFSAELLAHSAGRVFYPAKRSNMHYRHIELGAQMMQAGVWYRPAFYGLKRDRDRLIQAEVSNVRTNVGIIDVSTLGGIEVRGTDAAEFLNRMYTFGFIKQPVGKARYALQINEAGVVIDDGVACRLERDHFYVTATTGGVDGVARSMLKWNAQWRLSVDIANVTSAYCAINIAGPNARRVLEDLCQDVDIGAEHFPYMAVRQGTIAGISVRLIRVGFVGELGYELHAPQQYGEALWDILMKAGEAYGIAPFGVEAQRLLRLEKGHIIVGQDTDAMTHPLEINMGWAVSKVKPFYVGIRSLQELEKAGLKRVLAGFLIKDRQAPAPLESHLVIDKGEMIGRVTSFHYSATLKAIIGLAYVPPQRGHPGEAISIKVEGGVLVNAEIVQLPFYDPDNLRQGL